MKLFGLWRDENGLRYDFYTFCGIVTEEKVKENKDLKATEYVSVHESDEDIQKWDNDIEINVNEEIYIALIRDEYYPEIQYIHNEKMMKKWFKEFIMNGRLEEIDMNINFFNVLILKVNVNTIYNDELDNDKLCYMKDISCRECYDYHYQIDKDNEIILKCTCGKEKVYIFK